ncbi:MAG TPA: hypothetical protein V6D11_05950 [Waterburya sp.]
MGKFFSFLSSPDWVIFNDPDYEILEVDSSHDVCALQPNGMTHPLQFSLRLTYRL